MNFLSCSKPLWVALIWSNCCGEGWVIISQSDCCCGCLFQFLRQEREFPPFSLMLRDENENSRLSVSCFEMRTRMENSCWSLRSVTWWRLLIGVWLDDRMNREWQWILKGNLCEWEIWSKYGWVWVIEPGRFSIKPSHQWISTNTLTAHSTYNPPYTLHIYHTLLLTHNLFSS